MAHFPHRMKYVKSNLKYTLVSNASCCGSVSLNIVTLILSAFLLLCQPTRVVGQEIHFDQMSIAEGLSSNSVNTIFQDSYGVLWFGTLDGLDRYDGYTIDVFKHDNLKKQSLSNNRITQIYEDR